MFKMDSGVLLQDKLRKYSFDVPISYTSELKLDMQQNSTEMRC
jgi:hypothetical protein